MVEVQGNMVHYPALRRRLSFGYAELKAASPGDEQSAVAMLLIAVVHALGGHKFHRLLFAVDIAQAARRISDPDGNGPRCRKARRRARGPHRAQR